MNLEEIIRKRRSVRSFTTDPVSDDLLNEVIALAKKGPSAGAIRGFWVAVTRERIASYEAPVYVVICADPAAYEARYGARGMELYAIQDATIVGAYLQLLLVDRGLASCWIGAFKEHKIQRAIGTIELRPIAIIAVGYEK
jgi:nitroreductase